MEVEPRVESVWGVHGYAEHLRAQIGQRIPLTAATIVAETATGFRLQTDVEVLEVRIRGDPEGDEWCYRRSVWMQAAAAAPHVADARAGNWQGVASLLSHNMAAAAEPASLASGDPVGVLAAGDQPAFGAHLVDEASDGAWLVQPVGLPGINSEPQPTVVVPANGFGALPNWPFLGVSVACLRSFAAAHVAQLEGVTTEAACDRVVKPLTVEANRSLATCLLHLAAADEHGRPFVAPPTAFVSHARKYLFTDLLAAVEAFALAQRTPSGLESTWPAAST